MVNDKILAWLFLKKNPPKKVEEFSQGTLASNFNLKTSELHLKTIYNLSQNCFDICFVN